MTRVLAPWLVRVLAAAYPALPPPSTTTSADNGSIAMSLGQTLRADKSIRTQMGDHLGNKTSRNPSRDINETPIRHYERV
jgi:hypothetical protein